MTPPTAAIPPSHSLKLEGAVALVTGSGRGLGRMIAETLLAAGASVAIHDISEDAPNAFGESASLTALAPGTLAARQRQSGVSAGRHHKRR